MYFHDVYGRKILPNDYILINMNGKESTSLNHLLFVQLDENLSCKFLTLGVKSLVVVQCYKIENPSKELLDRLERPNKYSFEQTGIKDIYDRELLAGDLVFDLPPRGKFNECDLIYGIVIDSNHIFTKYNKIRKVSNVFKIESPINDEKSIYNELVYNYNEYIKNKTFFANKPLEVGDVFETNSYLHIYCGDYMFTVYDDGMCYINYSNSIRDAVGKPHKVFLRIKKSVERHMDFYRDYSYGWVGTKDMSDFIALCGLSNKSIHCLGLPNCYKFDLSHKRLGVFKENIGMCRRPDSTFVLWNKGRKCEVKFYFNYYL